MDLDALTDFQGAGRMELDGEPIDDLSSLLSRFADLSVASRRRVSFKEDEPEDEDGGKTGRLYVDIDGEEVEISDEASFFGAVSKLVLKGAPKFQFRTESKSQARLTADHDQVDRPGSSAQDTVERSRYRSGLKRTRVETDVTPMDTDENDVTPGNKRQKDSCRSQDAQKGRDQQPYVGMSVAADGLIVSKPDLFEKLLEGRKIVARYRDENGAVSTRELT